MRNVAMTTFLCAFLVSLAMASLVLVHVICPTRPGSREGPGLPRFPVAGLRVAFWQAWLTVSALLLQRPTRLLVFWQNIAPMPGTRNLRLLEHAVVTTTRITCDACRHELRVNSKRPIRGHAALQWGPIVLLFLQLSSPWSYQNQSVEGLCC